MRRAGYVVVGVALLAWIVLTPILLAFERGGPEHRDVVLPGGVPATFYLPDTYDSPKPPAVVVGHGYSGDRATMSSLSRSLAEAGYAVLAIDFAGHGANPRSSGAVDGAEELAAGLDWLEGSDEVDRDGLAVLGHSMGAYAVLDLVAVDQRPAATVVIGSSRSAPSEGREPPSLLALAGENDSSSVRSGSLQLVRDLASARFAQIDGANHISVLWFDDTVRETVAWLDRAFGIERETAVAIEDPRLGVALWCFLFVPFLFAGLGALAGRLGPRHPEGSPPRPRTLAFLAVAIASAIPIAAFVQPARFLGEGFGDVVSFLAVAGAIVCVPGIRRVSKPPAVMLARLAAVGLASLVASFVVLAPLGVVVHRLVPTPQRVLVAGAVTPLLAVFFVRLQATLRRGSVLRATAASIAGHFLVLVALAAGVVLGVFPGVVGLALPLLAGVFALVEVFGITAYAAGRNGVLVGLVESLWVAGLASVAMPLP